MAELYAIFSMVKKRPYAIPTAARDWIIDNKKFQRDSLVNSTDYSVNEGI